MRVAVVAPVYGNEGTLRPLADRLAAALAGRDWSLRLVVDASPDDSAAVAAELTVDPRIAVTVLTANVGQHAALARGDVAAVFAGRRGAYESWLRRRTGDLHRRLAARLTGLPADAGAFLAMGPSVRRAVVTAVRDEGAPSVVLAVARARERVTSVPVARDARPAGRSAWTGRARLRQSVRSLAWAARSR